MCKNTSFLARLNLYFGVIWLHSRLDYNLFATVGIGRVVNTILSLCEHKEVKNYIHNIMNDSFYWWYILVVVIVVVVVVVVVVLVVLVVVDLGFTLLTSQVISVAFHSEPEKSDKFFLRGSNFGLRFFYLS